MKKREAVLTFKRAPKPGDTITINNVATIHVRTGVRNQPKLDSRIYGFVAVVPAFELAAQFCQEAEKVINAYPGQFGVTARADQWRLRLTPVIVEGK